jgi:hypothetical protein
MNYGGTVQSAFLLVKRFDVLYTEFASRPQFTNAIYALPLIGKSSNAVAKRYRGLDREPVVPYDKAPAQLAEIRMAELEKVGRCEDTNIFDLTTLSEVWRWAQEEYPGVYEPVWARMSGSTDQPPLGYDRLGFEPSFFPRGFFSAVCDCMCFPRWHGTDKEGILFKKHFELLNFYGLFDNSSQAKDFLDYYLSFDWTERGDFAIIEIWAAAP